MPAASGGRRHSRRWLIAAALILMAVVVAAAALVRVGNDEPVKEPPSAASGANATRTSTPPAVDQPLEIVPPPATSGGVAEVPASITADCSTAVEREVMAWLTSLPKDTTARFQQNGCYGYDASMEVVDREDLVIDGNGATFKALTKGAADRATWRILKGRNVTLTNMTVRGSLPARKYHPGYEYQHGYDFRGTDGGQLVNVRAFNVHGDFVYVGGDRRDKSRTAPPARRISVRNSHFEVSGRQGVALVNVDGFSLVDSFLGDVAQTAIDVEPDLVEQTARDIEIRGNTFGFVQHQLFASVGKGGGERHGNVTIADNVMKEPAATCLPAVLIRAPVRQIRSGFRIVNNRLATLGVAFRIIDAADVEISGNTVTRTKGCSKVGVHLVASTNVRILDNRLPGTDPLVLKDKVSEGIRESGNTTSP